jgi:putative FmdB family regulatory protein
MPLYSYVCPKCNHEEDDVEHKMNENPAVICSECNGLMKRMICPTAFHLKGKGWERDGYS